MAEKGSQAVQIPTPNIQLIKVRIKGTTPIIFHKWSEKAIKMMLDKQKKKANAGKREVRDEKTDYLSTYYYDSEDRVAFKANAIKQAIIGAARQIDGIHMTDLRGALYVVGDIDDLIPVLNDGKEVRRKDTEKHARLVKDGGWMRQDMVRLQKGVADIRFRGQLPNWSMEFIIKFNADRFSVEQIMNLLQYAGFSSGLAEWRPEKGGSSGMFEIEN